MKTRFAILTFLLVGFCISVSGQENKLDSVGKALKMYNVRDTTRVSLLIDYTKYHQVRDIDSMLPLVKEALEISQEINYTSGLGYSYNALATYNLMKGDIDEALKAALKAKNILLEINDVDNLTFNNNLLARLYVRNQQPKKALEMHLATLELIKNKPSSDQKGGFYYYAAQAYERLDSLDQAQALYKKAYSISKDAGFNLGKVLASTAIGNLYNNRKEFKKAIPVLTESLQFHKANDQSYNIALTQYALAHSYGSIGNYKEALKLNSEAITILKKQNRKIDLRNAFKNQITYQNRLGDLKGENKALKNYHKIKDSIFSEEKVKVIEELKTKYETEKIIAQKNTAEAQVALAKAESDRNRIYFIAALLATLLLLLAGLLYFTRLRAKKKAELITLELRETQKRLALEKQYRDSELKALKAQLNPHFIFNALNSIQEYIILNEKNLASDYLGKFADLMRRYLQYSNAGYITLQQEIESLRMYLDLEALRFGDDFQFQVQLDKSLNPELLQIPTMLIQPYVENALKHGLLHKERDKKLHISFTQNTTQTITCSITDNGVGREASTKIKSQVKILQPSFSSQANESRLNLLKQREDVQIGVEIRDLTDTQGRASGTQVILDIPILKN